MSMKSILCSSLVATTLWAGPAASLSCLQQGVTDAFNRASDAEEAYVVLLGNFRFAPPPSSVTGDINAPREVTYQSVFEGQFLGPDGFLPIAPIDVTITNGCAAAWCGSMPSDDTVLAFVRMTDTNLELTVGPCGGQAFGAPSAQDIAQIEACMRGEACAPSEF